jgi:hypothetical protein
MSSYRLLTAIPAFEKLQFHFLNVNPLNKLLFNNPAPNSMPAGLTQQMMIPPAEPSSRRL